MEKLRKELTESIDEAEFDWLKPHIQKDVVIIVSTSLDLVEVGMAIAQDQTQIVDRWINEQLIAKPTMEQLAHWNQQSSLRFKALIVQPFVLIQSG